MANKVHNIQIREVAEAIAGGKEILMTLSRGKSKVFCQSGGSVNLQVATHMLERGLLVPVASNGEHMLLKLSSTYGDFINGR